MNSKILIFGSKNFNNSINEVKEYLSFSLVFFDLLKKPYKIDPSITAIIIESDFLNKDNLAIINNINNKPILFLEKPNNNKKCNYSKKILLPVSFFDFKNKIIQHLSTFEFLANSTFKVKDYILDKNEKKIIKDGIFISITEREVQLIELLYNEKKPLTKNYILKKIWNYSQNTDTHTVETHIYRLRKKIYTKFNDEKFILNFDKGYII